MVKAKTLKNGLRVVYVPEKGTETTAVMLLCHVGSRYESAEMNGASHFIEHLMFKGTKKRPKSLDLSRELDALGADYNAFTSKDVTGYHIKVGSKKVRVALDIVHDILTGSLFEKREIDKERQVIIEEIKMYEENPIMYIGDLIEQTQFAGNSLGWEIAGTRRTINKMKRKEIVKFYEKFYQPSRMVLCVSGNIPPNTDKLIQKLFGGIAKNGSEVEEYEPFTGFVDQKQPYIKAHHKKVEQVQLAYSFPGVGYANKDLYATGLLANILGGNMSSRLWLRIREEKGLAYQVSVHHNPYEDVGAFTIFVGLDKTKLKSVSKILSEELRNVARYGVKQKELKLAKDNIVGSIAVRMDNTAKKASWYARRQLFNGDIQSPDQYGRKIKKVTAKDIKRVAKQILDFNKVSVAVIGPYKSETEFTRKLTF